MSWHSHNKKTICVKIFLNFFSSFRFLFQVYIKGLSQNLFYFSPCFTQLLMFIALLFMFGTYTIPDICVGKRFQSFQTFLRY